MRNSALSTPTCFMPLACHVCKAGVNTSIAVKSVFLRSVVAEMSMKPPFSFTAAFTYAKQ